MQILSQARSKLLLKHPFYANLALSTPDVLTHDIPTAGTDMAKIYYNPDFVASLPPSQVPTLIGHEVLHIAQDHGDRLHQRDPDVWNQACDYNINATLLECGFEPIDGWLYDPRFGTKSADAIYTILMREKEKRQRQQQRDGQGQPQPGQGQPQSGQGDGQPQPGQGQPQPGQGQGTIGRDLMPGNRTAEEEAKVRESIKQRVAQAASAARLAGKMSAGLERLIGDILNPPLPWEDIMRHYMQRVTQDDESWSRPNRRHTDMILPSRRSLKIGPIAIIGDTSGSITEKELSNIGTQTIAIAEQLQPENIRVVWADTKVCGEQVFEQGDDIQLKPQGYGGTDMRVPLAHVEQFQPQVVVLITDGHTPWPDVEPDYPLIVVCTTDARVPIGEVIRL